MDEGNQIVELVLAQANWRLQQRIDPLQRRLDRSEAGGN
jgi:hypothetical protein